MGGAFSRGAHAGATDPGAKEEETQRALRVKAAQDAKKFDMTPVDAKARACLCAHLRRAVATTRTALLALLCALR
jgi:hypothetical protein